MIWKRRNKLKTWKFQITLPPDDSGRVDVPVEKAIRNVKRSKKETPDVAGI
jgi:hypothetical protein